MTSKQKACVPPSQLTGLYKADSIRDVAESLNIPALPDSIASALASDVEYRIHQVVEEAARFMRHARRTTMTTSDIDQALRVLNIEPLYGHYPHNPPTFRRAGPYPASQAAGALYFVEDEEIDFDRVIKEEKISVPKGPRWAAHWLAVEGVQPLIPENPPAIPKEHDGEAHGVNGVAKPAPAGGSIFPPTPPSSDRPSPIQAAKRPHAQSQQQLVKQVLSRELQLYYTRLTTALLPPVDQTKRIAALASLRHDAGLQALLPYLVRWVAEGVVAALRSGAQTDSEGKTLAVLLEVIGAVLDNPTLFIEPYLHQLLPPILSTLLHSSLPPEHATHLRTLAAQTLSHLLTQHSTTYPSLSPRIVKTLLLALIGKDKSMGTREGAVRGLMGIGKEAIRKGVVEGGGAKVVGAECAQAMEDQAQSSLVGAVMASFQKLSGRSARPEPLNPADDADAAVVQRLRDTVGDFFADRLTGDRQWALGVLQGNEAS
ncbi:TAF-domain-containing protein [Phanerochaete sordida]|uniref:TBP-associated factor 6 n=1 Tax=Phanerochaete sordida TaxID=48140 RepID=A0A9P3LF64_9APHY|nr:TAF-domain-containing protein [Phanerochaete sordida]